MIDPNEAWLQAIEVMTAYTDNDNDTSFATGIAGERTAGEDGGLTLVAGLINLSGMLLYNLAKQRGDGSAEGQRAILNEFALVVKRRQERGQ